MTSQTRFHRHRSFCLILVFTLAAGGSLLLAARLWPGFADTWAGRAQPLFAATLGRLCGLLPWSLAELVLIIALPGLVLALILRLARRKSLAPLVRLAAGLLSCGLLVFAMTAGVSYHRVPWAQSQGWEIRDSSQEELVALCQELIALSGEALAAGAGEDLTRWELDRYSRQALSGLAADYPDLDTTYNRPKPLLLSGLMSQLRLTGIFSPFTMEANYNRLIPNYEQPYVICHELAHTAGWAREEEAGLIAFLACAHSDQPAFRYSAAATALAYCLNAYRPLAAAEEYELLWSQVPEKLREDYARGRDYWSAYQGQAAELSRKVNDAYLKANGQEEGVRSYGKMVDLLLAYYRED